ncbi:hypothetical protein EON79_05605, partial [bacterium]
MGFLPFGALPPVTAQPNGGGLVPYALRCESLTDPEGIGSARPELSWKLRAVKDGLRDLRQSAYELRVGTAPGKGDVWNSGRVASSSQYGVRFGGKPLRSGQVVFWTVRTWDGRGLPSAWSAPARFSVGLLSEKDWTGQWIGWDIPEVPNAEAKRFEGASWIWSAAEDPLRAAKGFQSFERTFTL